MNIVVKSRSAFWIVIFSFLILAATLFIFNELWSNLATQKPIFYYAQPVGVLLACLLIPLCLIILVIYRRSITPPNRKNNLCLWIFVSGTLLFVANLIACATLPKLLNRYDNLSAMYVNNHVYRLDSVPSGTLSDIGELLMLWKCDASGLFCQIIYSQDYYNDISPKLINDSLTNILSLNINEKTVFSISYDVR